MGEQKRRRSWKEADGGPRERLLTHGPGALQDSELLAVLLGVGLPGQRVDVLAQRLLAESGGLVALLREEPREMGRRPGLGPSRAARIVAALELGRRAQKPGVDRPRLKTAAEVYHHLAPSLLAQRREAFHVLCLSARNVLLADVRIAEGTVNSCPVDPREVFAPAVSVRATAIVVAHNHPSGDPEPSAHDLDLTRQLAEGARVLGMQLLDHIVVGDGRFVSFLERGLIPGKLSLARARRARRLEAAAPGHRPKGGAPESGKTR